MKRLNALCLSAIFLLVLSTARAQQAGPTSPDARPWNAHWIAAPDDPGTAYGVYYFRKSLELAAKPASFVIHVSADNRYKLYVNGSFVSLGPARGDLYYWNFETVDIASLLTAGKNNISAIVWNEAQARPEAQITLRTSFIVQGNTEKEDIINTNNSWKCIRDKGHAPFPGFFFAATSGEMIDMNKVVKDWSSPTLDDSNWPAAANLFEGRLKGMSDGFGWMLVPSSLPQMEMTDQRIPVLRKAVGMEVPVGFPGTKVPLTVPANSFVSLLLDQVTLTNAYVTLQMSKGKGAGISLAFAESLYKAKGSGEKGNRDSIDGKYFSGRMDSVISNGENGQSFTTLTFRTYRYVRMNIQTHDDPLVIDDLYGTFTGYPFKQTAKFNGGGEEAQRILDIGWRTARLNAVETYTDCPYYEQLQYIGDTRIQAMVSYYYSGDDRLARNALNLMDHSRLAEGVTFSRYPTHSTQVISTFSLWYIGMLHDYWMYRGDSAFIGEKLVGERAVLNFFAKYQATDGSLKNTPYWTFVDWANGKDWFVGSPPKSSDGGSAIIDLQLLWAFEWAAEMEAKIGLPAYASMYQAKAAQLKRTIRKKYWNSARKLFADSDDQTHFSQHANALAILAGVVTKDEMPGICRQLLNDQSLTQCTIYFKYYLHMALTKGGLGNDYVKWLGVWRDNIRSGLTTWGEEPNVNTTRSDCHAWGSSPNIEYFRTVLGIDSDAPGFARIKIEPHLGEMQQASGEIPHPNGTVTVNYQLVNNTWKMKINLPARTTGVFIWKGKNYPLRAGDNAFTI